jgi:hypothetical protein
LDDVIKKKEGEAKEVQDEESGDGLDAFRKLQSEGLKLE